MSEADQVFELGDYVLVDHRDGARFAVVLEVISNERLMVRLDRPLSGCGPGLVWAVPVERILLHFTRIRLSQLK